MDALLNKKTGNTIFVVDIVGGINRARKLAQSEYYELILIEEPKPIKKEEPIIETPKKRGRKPKTD
jgi:hypothetical protein